MSNKQSKTLRKNITKSRTRKNIKMRGGGNELSSIVSETFKRIKSYYKNEPELPSRGNLYSDNKMNKPMDLNKGYIPNKEVKKIQNILKESWKKK